MNLEQIQNILNSKLYTQLDKEKLILETIAKDDKAVAYLLAVVKELTDTKNNLIQDMNFELSRAMAYIENYSTPTAIEGLTKEFITGEIDNFYKRYKSMIENRFKKEIE